MRRKSLMLVGLPIIIVLIIASLFLNDYAAGQRGSAPAPAFTGRVKLKNGTYLNGVTVRLGIDGKDYTASSGYSQGIGDGFYAIGRYNDTGDFCLKADTIISSITYRDAAQGNKPERGTIGINLELSSTGPDCEFP